MIRDIFEQNLAYFLKFMKTVSDTCNLTLEPNTSVESIGRKFLIEVAADYTNAGTELFSFDSVMQATLDESGGDSVLKVELCIPLQSQEGFYLNF